MAFLNSIFLWGTLAAVGVSIPIIIHLLNRYKHRQVDWAAMELLRKALTIRSRQVRIEDILMLILRCLAVLLIALALARPTITGSSGKWFGGQQQVGVVIALDASYSMGYKDVTTRFDKAKDQARAIARTLRPGDGVTLVLLGETPRILLHNAGYDADDFEKTLNEKAQIKPESLNLDVCLDRVKALVGEIKGSSRECYIISDAQVASWGGVPAKSKQILTEIGKEARIFFLPASSPGTENLAIARFEHVSGAMRKGTIARYRAEVINFGRQTAKSVQVRLLANGQPADQHMIGEIRPNSTQAVDLFFRCDEPGNIRLSAELGTDALAIDNQAFAVAHVRDQVRVLCVDGSPSDQPYQGETDFLLKALLPRKTPSYASLSVERTTPSELSLRRLTDFNIIFLANVGEIRPEVAKNLRAFVEAGGGLFVFLGDRVDGIDYNRRLVSEGVPILPAELGEVMRAPQNFAGYPIAAASKGHPLSTAVERLPADLLKETHVKMFFSAKPRAGAQVILTTAGQTAAPLLIEQSLGRGKVLLCTTSADKDWNDIVLNPVYPILLAETVNHLTQQSYETPFTVNQPLVLSIPPELAKGGAMIKSPLGNESIVNVEKIEGQTVVRFPQTDQAGIYEIKTAPDAQPLLAAFNIDTRESAIACLDKPGLSAAFTGLPIRTLTDSEDLPQSIRTLRVGREMWKVLLLLGLGLLVLESLLAHRFSKRMQAKTSIAPRSTKELLAAKVAA
jgi:hypothetical protein